MSNSSLRSSTPFRKLSELGEQIEAATKRLKKMYLAGEFLDSIPLEEVEAASLLLIGQPFPRTSQRTLDLDWSALSQILQELLNPPPNTISQFFSETGDIGEVVRRIYQKSGGIRQTTLFSIPLTILDVYQTFSEIADIQGSGSRKRKMTLLRSLFTRVTPLEAKYLTKLLFRDQRIGFSEGMLESTIARKYNAPLELVQRANMLRGNVGELARITRAEGVDGLQKVKLRPFTPLLPMLAARATDIDDVLQQYDDEWAFEMKLDGARVQIHLQENNGATETRIYSRRLTDVTASLPDVVNLVEQEISVFSCILEGEVIALGPDGRPLPFQNLMRRFRRIREVEMMTEKIPVTLFLFDLLMLDGEVLIDSSYGIRRESLSSICGSIPLVSQIVTRNTEEATRFFQKAIQEGHEGLIAKRIDSPYKPGSRGKLWLKIKQTMETLDLVIIAAEWGTGRRHKWLSDYHLGARDPETGDFQMLGKTFKGLTDAEFEEITQRLLELKIDQPGRIVVVQPQIVVEVEYDEIQRSPRYSSGMALRFARIKRIRYDKTPNEADTIQRVRSLFDSQFKRKSQSDEVG
ncbi:ATP-dependent DNA ligase [Candidatus Borrarchaeum sp.]|uniref:ATP-dependent DNA ligase n=1 Tax=Candidatus Borrarchaeum sp. TaxID=2846742 RepID=UPI00257A0093|nr:ATP-dependent DNA ligase [Candidatus Borrarchaeum sp.]